MDIADMADIHIEEQLKACLSQFAEKSSKTCSTGFALTCEVCEDPIPPERHKLLSGCTTCVDCATQLEQANRMQGRDLGAWWF